GMSAPPRVVEAVDRGQPVHGQLRMKPWTDVVQPHDDILGGDLEMAVFAADLGSVVRQEGSVREVYGDPAAFFRATYLTSSMHALLGDVLGALAGAGGDRVLQLRTPFG